MSKYRVFISHSSRDSVQVDLFNFICETFDNHKYIEIIDVSYNNANDDLRKNIFNEIDNSNIVFCLLTPNYPNEGDAYINKNVFLELGYAMSTHKKNVYIFIEEDELKKSDYKKMIPSMIEGMQYKTYFANCTECCDIVDIINDKYNKQTKHDDENIDYGYFLLERNLVEDKHVLANMRIRLYDLLNNEIIENPSNIDNIIQHINKFLCYDIIEDFFLFIKEYVSTKRCIESNNNNFIVTNCFMYVLSDILLEEDDIWFNKKNNENRILKLLDNINYLFFHKFNNSLDDNVNIVRMNFALSIFKIFKNNSICCKEEFIELLNKSRDEIKDIKYNDFIENLKLMNGAKCHNDMLRFQDRITLSKNIYNKVYITY